MYVCTHSDRVHAHIMFFCYSPKQVNCLFSTKINRHTLFFVDMCLSLCFALCCVVSLRVGAMPKMLSYRAARSLSRSRSLSISRLAEAAR